MIWVLHKYKTFFLLKGSVCEKWKGVKANVESNSIVIATNLTSIYCVYKEKIVKNDSYRRPKHPHKFRKLQDSTRILKKSILLLHS